MDRPDGFPEWADENPVDPVSGQLARVEPPDGQKQTGWDRNQVPPRQWMNWLAWKTNQWIQWLDRNRSKLDSYSVSELPPAAEVGAGAMIFVTNEASGPAPAYSDGQDWRRFSDNEVVSE